MEKRLEMEMQKENLISNQIVIGRFIWKLGAERGDNRDTKKEGYKK